MAEWLPYVEGILVGIAAILTALGALLGKLMLDQRKLKTTANETARAQAATTKQLLPNGGKSLRDSVDRIERVLIHISERQSLDARRADTDHQGFREQLAQLEERVTTIETKDSQ